MTPLFLMLWCLQWDVPCHPQSPLKPLPRDPVVFAWAGGLTPHEITVTTRLVPSARKVRLYVSKNPNLKRARRSRKIRLKKDDTRIVKLRVDRLLPGTRYYYGLKVDGRLVPGWRGTFHTPANGPFSFTFAAGSCAETGSSGKVFDMIRGHDPLFFLHMGDMHYENIDRPSVRRYRDAYESVLRSPSQSRLYLSAPIAYMWDDHDYGPNNSDRTSRSRDTACRTYREHVPHYPLTETNPEGAIYQAFTIGRVRFILTDHRSRKSPFFHEDNEEKTILGPAQKAWFKRELLAARDSHALIVWVSTTPWIEAPKPYSDRWAGFDTERRELASFIEQEDIRNLILLGGDTHMVALDDGRNSNYAVPDRRGFPVLVAAALDRKPQIKGGTYSHGSFAGPGQYGLIRIFDEGRDVIEVHLSGRNFEHQILMEQSFIFDVPKKRTREEALPIAVR